MRALPLVILLVAAPAAAAPLLTQSDLVHQGAFRLPAGSGTKSFDYGGTAIAVSAKGTLYLVGHDWDQLSAEVSIPAPKTGSLASLSTATLLQPFADALEGKIGSINPSDPNSKKIGGQLVLGGQLIVSAYSYYDAAGSQSASHFTRPLDLATKGQVKGPFKVGSLGPRYLAGYLAAVPAAWQAALGGPALTGQCCLAIISTTSLGPAVFAFDPAKLGAASPVPATPLVYYPSDHPTLGTWEGNGAPNPVYNMKTSVRGVVLPEGTRSLLFFGTTGTGKPCYGAGTSNASLDGKPVPGEPGVIYCYDPDDSSKGTHAYPYASYVWAYDLDELAQVKSGAKQPWQVKPYATFSLSLPLGTSSIEGAAYDPATARIYLSQGFADGDRPLIQVLKVAASPAPDGGAPRDSSTARDAASDRGAGDLAPREAGSAGREASSGDAPRGDAGQAATSDGCGCSATPTAPSSLLALLALAGLLRRRR